MTLATKLVSLRKQKGLTQMELAEKLNVSRQAISRWEVGAAVPSMENLKTLGKLYAVSVNYLLDDMLDVSKVPEEKELPDRPDENSYFLGKMRWNRISAILAVFVLLAIVACLLVTQFGGVDASDRLVPFSDLDTGNNNYSTESFSIEW